MLAVALAAIAIVVRSGSNAPQTRTGSVVRVDPASGAVTARYPLSAHPSAVAVGPQVWAADYRQGTLWRIDPVTGAVTRISANGSPRSLAILGGRVYVGSDGPSLLGGNVTRYFALTGRRIDSVDVVPCSVAAGDGASPMPPAVPTSTG